jgi:iron-sulfur cluster repair protein YtfE (RIC family)
MRNPIDELLREHVEIMGEVDALRRALAALDRRGESAVPEALPAFRAVARMMATTLLRHAAKEDEVLFPALERVWGRREGTPTAVMRMEHSMIHNRVGLFRDTLAQLEAEHPEIVGKGGALQAVLDGDPDVGTLRRVGEEIVHLLDIHFGKEEDILFPMAREMLSPAELDQAARSMDAVA